MTKMLFAGVLSAAMALSGVTATPAQADNDDVARALAAIAAIAIIGAAIDHRNDRRVPVPPRLEPLPTACVFEFWGPRGPDHALSARCVEQEMRHPERLPAACRSFGGGTPGRGGNRNQSNSRHSPGRELYDISCLYRAGYEFDR